MKRKNILWAVLLCFCLTLASCAAIGQGESHDNTYVPQPAPLPKSAGIDWNNIPEDWVGTGGATATDHFDCGIYQTLSDNYPYETTWNSTEDDKGISYSVSTINFTGLSNTGLQSHLNDLVSQKIAQYREDSAFMDKNLTEEALARRDVYASISIYPNVIFCGNTLGLDISCYRTCYSYDPAEDIPHDAVDEQSDYSVFDLSTGKQLGLSDIFVDGVDINGVLSPLIADSFADTELIRPFRGLPADYGNFILYETHLQLYFPKGNPYTGDSLHISIPIENLSEYLAQPVSSTAEHLSQESFFYSGYRDGTLSIVSAGEQEAISFFGREDFSFRPYYLKPQPGNPAVENINASIAKIYDDVQLMSYPVRFEDFKESEYQHIYTSGYCSLTPYRSFVQLSLTAAISSYNDNDYSSSHTSINRVFDAKTGRVLALSDLVLDQNAAKEYLADQGFYFDDLSTIYNMMTYAPEVIYCYTDDYVESRVELTAEYLNLDFFK